MEILVDITVSGSDVEVGDVLRAAAPVHVRFEQVVPTGSSPFPYVFVRTDDVRSFCDQLAAHEAVDALTLVEEHDSHGLAKLEWGPNLDAFLGCVLAVEPVVQTASGSPEQWELSLRFDDQQHLSTFQSKCTNQGISFRPERIRTKPNTLSPDDNLTLPQRRVLEIAVANGYFDVPRKTTILEIADELDISDQAVSARLRRAMRKLAENAVSSRAEALPEFESSR